MQRQAVTLLFLAQRILGLPLLFGQLADGVIQLIHLKDIAGLIPCQLVFLAALDAARQPADRAGHMHHRRINACHAHRQRQDGGQNENPQQLFADPEQRFVILDPCQIPFPLGKRGVAVVKVQAFQHRIQRLARVRQLRKPHQTAGLRFGKAHIPSPGKGPRRHRAGHKHGAVGPVCTAFQQGICPLLLRRDLLKRQQAGKVCFRELGAQNPIHLAVRPQKRRRKGNHAVRIPLHIPFQAKRAVPAAQIFHPKLRLPLRGQIRVKKEIVRPAAARRFKPEAALPQGRQRNAQLPGVLRHAPHQFHIRIIRRV